MKTKGIILKKNQTATIWDTGNTIQLLGKRSQKIGKPEEVHVSRDASLDYYFVWNRSSINRRVTIHLSEEGASARVLGMFIAEDKNEVNFDSTIIHHAPNTYGNTLVKGALTDASKSSLNGMIKIDKGADGSDDLLTERVLLLSPQARAEAKPMLEIDANEVKATHAATVSKINEEQLYYLRTRGVTKQVASALMVQGFLQEVIDQFPEQIKKSLPKKVSF
jgi:Fe-S cluster assembly protein SufD